MKFADLHLTKDEDFLRLTGIKYSTFSKILAILQEAELKKFYRGGKSNKLPLADRILMTLEYWRQYRTYFHIGKSYGISESKQILTTHFSFGKLVIKVYKKMIIMFYNQEYNQRKIL